MKTGMWLLAMLLAGCSAGSGNPTADGRLENRVASAQPTKPQRSNYPERMRQAITQEMQLPGKYKSKSCAISIHLLPDGSLKDFKVLEGDAELCAAASQAVQRAKLPKMANETEFALFRSVVLDFVP
ncbi:cell envelope integrity TolA C-terminal domain-containing protein [Serratia proteamaculans]|uniref:cell envelope integrity TolA C-terminal domain-containing protein n=1 Tax=Serratia proteamaculans TaxID=28151 RepID=UPI00217B1D2A|nr:cell envelope integrity TolA C-terminal domain-containing protein [Serratia proteamaculans]CAI1547763.1 cell envelope integrity inner membrane protein TolA [Serratia proteamaculans]